ncbi:hypothetical protein [Ferrimicrobium acidiphilum]|jgi:hypothetical protein|uniref:hypothetical protein n=1 Tax=Ferrimicrobium acidiphilum TaxID=121039 RepID=UPI0023F0F651|nr:hypothetical protein [Ferrimicrobium acidiphilum]
MDSIFDKLPWDGQRAKPPFWMSMPLDSLIVCFDPNTLLALELEFKRNSGLPLEFPLTVDPMCAYPLPEVGLLAGDEPLARKIINLEWFDHPVAWLRGDILKPHSFNSPAENDQERIEFDVEIALRIALQLEVSGFYQSKNGIWIPLSDRLGIDLADPFDVARIQAWQAGEPDSVFDSFDIGAEISDLLPIDEAIVATQDTIGYALLASGAIAAYRLAEDVERFIDEQNTSMLATQAISVVDLGWDFCHAFLTDSETDAWEAMNSALVLMTDGDALSTETALQFLNTALPILRRIAQDNDDMVDEAYHVIAEIRASIRDAQGVGEE